MNNEVKLILTKLKIVVETKENGLYLFDREHSKILLDYINALLNQLETYENMRKELINIIEYTNFIEVETLEKFKSYLDELMNILNKVGDYKC